LLAAKNNWQQTDNNNGRPSNKEISMNEHQNDPNHQLTPPPAPTHTSSRAGETLDEITSTIRDLFNRVPETVNKAVERAMNVRDTTVLVRLPESSSDAIDTLIEEGIKAQSPLFQRIQDKLGEIERLRSELRNSVAP
jgi:hypothetical protein